MRKCRHECFDTLSANKGTSAFVECSTDHHGHAPAAFVKVTLDSEQTGFQVQRVDRSLGQQDVNAGFAKGFDLCVIAVCECLVGCRAVCRIVHLGADRQLHRCWTNGPSDKPRFIGSLFSPLVSRFASTSHSGDIDLVNQLIRQAKLHHSDWRCTERVRFDDITAGFVVGVVNRCDLVWMGQAEDIGKILEIFIVICESIAPNGCFVQLQPLNHGPHRTI